MKDTDKLQQELMETEDLDQYLSENKNEFIQENNIDILKKLFAERKITKAALAKNAGISEVYLHQIFSGKRNPSRNRLLCICFGLNASIDETQELLKTYGYAPLYAKNRRDAIILFGMQNGSSLFETEDKLFAENEETLMQ